MRVRILARLALVVLLGVGAGSALRLIAQGKAPATAQEEAEGGTDYPYPRHLNLPINSHPLSIISFTLFPGDNGNGSSTLTNYLAVLDESGELRIFRPAADGKLVTEFSLSSTKTVGWFRLYSFPSDAHPGVVIVGEYDASAEHGGFSTGAVCFVNGKFRVVYRGDQAAFVNISGFEMPELFQYTDSGEDIETGNTYPTRVRIWTWVGMQYKQVIEIPYKQRFSPQVLHAIRKVQERGKTLPVPLQWTMPQ
ncbi:MAG TPA: hypothetical protein VNM47_17410 [Terriglobia bacterium]|nr:hypothetical protein [Terriglobia bacterium]